MVVMGSLSVRHISDDIKRKIEAQVSSEFGQSRGDEEFLPDREDAEIRQREKDESTITLDLKDDDSLRVAEDVGGKMFKYDLPLENEPILFKSKSALMVQDQALEPTAVENLYDVLEMDKDTAFETFIIKHH